MKTPFTYCIPVSVLTLMLIVFSPIRIEAQGYDKLPLSISTGEQGTFHAQGIAVDTLNGFVYVSFTTKLIKMDMKGQIVGSVNGMVGHLGCLALNPDDGRLYGSLEYKNDEIGKGITSKTGGQTAETGFYIAIFDVSKINRINMNAERDGVMSAVYLKDVVDDYQAKCFNNGKERLHRYGCSGIDGVTFAPEAGNKSCKLQLYVAYGIYGDIERTDNDYQVVLAYDIDDWKKYEQPLSQKKLHKTGPQSPAHKYFVFTGNTTYGIQNLAYDRNTGFIFAAVYKGTKTEYPNFSLFAIDTKKDVDVEKLKGITPEESGEVLKLASEGKQSGYIRGWNFQWGTTGICSIGDGLFYVSHQNRNKETGQESSTICLYKWTGNDDAPFLRVTDY